MSVAVRLAVFLALLVLIWGGGHFYAGRRLIARSRLSPAATRLAWGLLALIAALPLWVMVGGRVGAPASDGVKMAGFVAMGFSSLLVTFLVASDLGQWVSRLWRPGPKADDTGVDGSRRLFLQRTINAGVAGGAATLSAAGYGLATSLPDVVKVKVPIQGLDPRLEGFRIVQLSDIHVGPTIGRRYLQGLVDLANAQAPDLVAVTGDLIDGFVQDLAHDVEPLGELRGKHGVYFVTGNHEYYWDGPAWCDHVASLGLTVLGNEHRVIEHGGAALVVAGIHDHRAGSAVRSHASDPVAALRGAPQAFKLMLAHQPRSAPGAAGAGAHLTISGHTHGGQYFPMNIFVHLFQPWVAGLHAVEKMWLYVSRGSGYWGPPNRLGAAAEVTVLELTAA